MIQKISINRPNNNEYRPSFSARPLAEYHYLNDKSKQFVVYKLEKSDLPYLQHLVDNLDKFYKKYDVDNESAKQVIEEAFNAGIAILKGKHSAEAKADILMGFYDQEPSSILIGNVLKIDKQGKTHYSSRKNHAKKETELDWLATWNKKIPGEGQATVYEYFCQLLKAGFKHCFVRSELPEKSSAVNFYTKMGFEKLSDESRAILRKNDNQYIIGKYDNEEDEIIPMKATVGDMINIIRQKANSVLRKEIKNKHSHKLKEEIFE